VQGHEFLTLLTETENGIQKDLQVSEQALVEWLASKAL
jgi:hypothetical protein